MANTTFVQGTVIQPEWAQFINDYAYNHKEFKNLHVDYGATGDGVADDTAALATAAASGGPVIIPVGIWTTTASIKLAQGTRFYGCGNFSGVARVNQTTGTSTIWYTGAANDNTALIVASDANFGVRASNNLMNVGLLNITLDGNYLIGYGLYATRSLSNNVMDYITVMGTTQHAFWANECWNGSPTNWQAFLNKGAGITLGADTFGWGVNAFDQCTCTSFFGYINGADGSGTNVVYQNAFWEPPVISTATAVGSVVTVTTVNAHGYTTGDTITVLNATPAAYNGTYTVTVTGTTTFTYTAGSAPGGNMTAPLGVINDSRQAKEYGIGFFGGRGTVFINPQGANNGGAGLYINLNLTPVQFIGGYFENDAKSSNNLTGNAWEIWFQSTAVSNGVKFDGFNLGGTSSAIRITGVAPSRRGGTPKFIDFPIIKTIFADFGNYRTVDCDPNTVYTNYRPSGFREQYGGYRNLDIIGSAVFDASAGSINLLNKEGIISSVAYTSAGNYLITLTETFTSARYGVMVSTGANRVASYTSVTTSSFVINNSQITAGAFALTDSNARITVWVTGYYT